MEIDKSSNQLIGELVALIEEGKKQLAYAATATTALTYWRVGKRINTDVLANKRANYGKHIVVSVARQLMDRYGKSYEEKNLRRMMQFAQIFSDEKIVVSLIRQLSAFAPEKERIVVMPDRFDIQVVMSDPQYQRIGGV
jgi:hypothetical protein